jgi:hypothetical protein
MKTSGAKIFLTSLTAIICFSCKQTTTPLEEPISAPSRNLPASEIMKLQGITSIHYVDYDSVVVNGNSDSGFVAFFENFIDSSRMKMIQYYLGTPNWNITVYDLNIDTAWNYYSGQLTYPQLPDLQLAFEMNIQAYLGSWLQGPFTFLRTEYICDKLCNVFTDSTGYQEWVWTKYRLPIQRRVESYYDIHQITVFQKRAIEVNIQFSNSIFEPPG